MDWGEFRHTVLHFASEPPLRVDLRDPVSADVRAQLSALGFERSFGVITASNPMGRTEPAAVNAELGAKLQRDLAAMERRFTSVEACSPDGSHCEHSFAVVLELQPLVALACQYDQLAIFWYDGEAFWILPARSSVRALRLPA